MTLRIIVAGATGWTGGAVVKAILAAPGLCLAGAVARSAAGQDIGTVLGLGHAGIDVSPTLGDALAQFPADILIDFTKPDSVKARVLQALGLKLHVVIGTSGLSAVDYGEIDAAARKAGRGVIAAGNFSLTAALAKRFALLTAPHAHSREIIDYAGETKIDAPSGSARELAEALAAYPNRMAIPVENIKGHPEARGADIAGTQVHSLRLPGYALSFETVFGLPGERLSIRHDAGAGAAPYVGGALLAAREVVKISGLVRGMDNLLFKEI